MPAFDRCQLQARLQCAKGRHCTEEVGFRGAKYYEFPMSNFLCWGGCLHGEGAPEKTAVLFCKRCRVLHRAWDEEHGLQTTARAI
jgi:hypothetical protein